MEFQKLEVGKPFPNYMPKQEGVQFDMRTTGAAAIVSFGRPTAKEIEQFDSKNPFQIKFVVLDNIIILLFKIGSLNWMDAPYTPHLSPDLGFLSMDIPDGQGYSLLLSLVDYPSGIVKSLRYIGLGTKFSQDLKKAILQVKESTFHMQDYYNRLNNIYAKYSTDQLEKLAKSYYKI